MFLSRSELHSRPERPGLLIYTKATLEIDNIGVTGARFSQKLKKTLPRQVAVQGAGYNFFTSPLSLFKGGSDSAARKMVEVVNNAIAIGPEKMIFLCGYGQGTAIVRKAVLHLTAKSRASISGIIPFGDPSRLGSRMPSDVDGKVLNLPAHLGRP